MYRRDSDFSVPIGCSKSLAKYIRHLRYVDELERKHTVRYYDNIRIIKEETDNEVIRNIAIGTGVILLCVTISIVTAGAGATESVSVIFATSANRQLKSQCYQL